MNVDQARVRLKREGQEQVLRFWDRLDGEARTKLLKQVAGLDFAVIRRMRDLLAGRAAGDAATGGQADPAPADVVEPDAATRAAAVVRGEQALRAGRVGVLLVAGGQGSRLGFEGPKGAYPIGPVTGAVLFYFHARKVLALTRTFGAPVPFYIMTSEANDADTRACFEAHGFFGLVPGQVFFFRQGMWPALDGEGRLMLDAPGHIFMGPDGHGGTLSALRQSGGLADMRRRGLETLFYFQVDNPLVEVADPAFLGMHLNHGADLSIKVCAKRDAQEGLGMVVRRQGRHELVEYTEFTEAQKNRRTPSGELYFKYGSVAIHVFRLAFLEQEAAIELPLHVAHKKIPYCAEDGTIMTPAAPNGFKFEKFIFDLLPHAGRVLNVAFDRAEEFSPVKNAAGADSPESCQRDLVNKWARWFASMGVAIPRDDAGNPAVPIEIDPAYARTAAELQARLAGVPVPDFAQPISLKAP